MIVYSHEGDQILNESSSFMDLLYWIIYTPQSPFPISESGGTIRRFIYDASSLQKDISVTGFDLKDLEKVTLSTIDSNDCRMYH